MGERHFVGNPWQPPVSLAEAMKRKIDLGADIQNIQEQLGDRDRHVEGRRMTEMEYWQWHRKAKTALLAKLAEFRDLKKYIQENSRSKPSSHMSLLLRGMARLLKRLGGEEDLMTEIEQCLQDEEQGDR